MKEFPAASRSLAFCQNHPSTGNYTCVSRLRRLSLETLTQPTFFDFAKGARNVQNFIAGGPGAMVQDSRNIP